MRFLSPTSRPVFAALLLTLGLALWTAASWPLPRFFAQAIPHTNLNPETHVVRPIAPGDHLQLLYHFWLGLDAVSGQSPLFHNVYEFNLGDDSARLQPDLYYMPFSIVYAAVAPLAGHAAGWNAAGLASVLFGMLALGLLARRFSPSPAAALLAAAVAAAFPYRWIALFTGSPTGFGIAFPALLFYGIDRAVRDRSPVGGLLAGLAIFCAYTSDLHTFYFSALAAPCFALLSFSMAHPSPRRWPAEIPRVLLPLLPFAALLAAAVAVSSLMSRHLSESVMAAGRSLNEMASYSPPAAGLFSSARSGMGNHLYFGVPLLLLLAAALAAWALPLRRRGSAEPRPPFPERLAAAALFAAAAVAILLALGIHGPFEGAPIRLIRKIVPKYTMIRQTVKIYSLMPAFLAPLLALLFSRAFAAARRSALGLAAAALLLALSAWTLADALSQTAPGFCRLPRTNAAYAAVAADDVANAGRPPQALAIPLWPGDSHWTSLNEYAVMLSRVRLVNGYAPAVPAEYLSGVFRKFESLNQGHATDDQLDALLSLGVRHLILHSDAFPEKVSPFPPAATLRALANHPRLAPLADDGLCFAFRILPKGPIGHVPHANWSESLHASARSWFWTPPLAIAQGESAPLLFRSPVFPAPNLRLLLRLSPGSAQPLLVPPGRDGVAQLTHPLPGHPDWLQAELPSPTGALVSAVSGPVSLEQALLVAGDLPSPGPSGEIVFAPALLFHKGKSSPGNPAVSFDPESTAAGIALHGPHLPVPPGFYDVSISCSFPPGAAESPGVFRVLSLPDRRVLAEIHVSPPAETFTLPAIALGPDPLRLEFLYHANAPVVVRSISLRPATLLLRPASP